MDLIALRDPARDDFGHLKIVASISRAQAFHDARPILYLTILAHLPLAFEPRDGKAETHNAAQHNLYVSVGRICRRLRFSFIPLLLGSKLGYVAE